MSTLLCIETSGAICSIAWVEDGEVIHSIEKHEKNSHSKYLSVMIDDLFSKVGAHARSALDGIGLSLGPGSYTGLRIGASVAKGLAFALDIPIVGMHSTDIMCSAFLADHPGFEGLVCPMIDARRMEVYASVYDQSMNENLELQPLILDSDSLLEFRHATELVFVGDGSAKFKEVCQLENARFVDEEYLLAKNMAALATGQFESKNFLDTAYFEPNYLKEFMIVKSKKKLF